MPGELLQAACAPVGAKDNDDDDYDDDDDDDDDVSWERGDDGKGRENGVREERVGATLDVP